MANPREQALARLSISAFSIDAMVVTLCIVGAHKLILRYMLNPPEWIFILMLPVMLVVHYLIVEFLAGGISVGRLCTGLKIQDKNTGRKPSFNSAFKRFCSVLKNMGVPSLNPKGLPEYNKRAERCFYSEWAGSIHDTDTPVQRNVMPATNQKISASQATITARGLKILQGPHRGLTALFNNGKNFSKDGFFIVGRDGKSCDLVLTNDKSVSAIHSRIALKNNRFYIIDGKSASQASSSGTFVNNIKVDAKSPRLMKVGDVIKAGQTIMQVR